MITVREKFCKWLDSAPRNEQGLVIMEPEQRMAYNEYRAALERLQAGAIAVMAIEAIIPNFFPQAFREEPPPPSGILQ